MMSLIHAILIYHETVFDTVLVESAKMIQA